jgi:hypothetical protein
VLELIGYERGLLVSSCYRGLKMFREILSLSSFIEVIDGFETEAEDGLETPIR